MYTLADDFGPLPLPGLVRFDQAIESARIRAHKWDRPITVTKDNESWVVWPGGKVEKAL